MTLNTFAGFHAAQLQKIGADSGSTELPHQPCCFRGELLQIKTLRDVEWY
jgi:hypothetical protein